MTPAPAPSLASAPTIEPLEFEAQQGWTGLNALEPAWQALCDSLGPEAWFQHRPQWVRSYLASGLCDPDSVWLVTARRGGQLVAIFPLQYQNFHAWKFSLQVLGSMEDDELQLSDFVFRQHEDSAELFNALVVWLRRQSQLRWSYLRLRKVRQHSALWFSAQRKLPALTLVLQHEQSAYFDTSVDYEHATAAMSSDFRRNLRRQLRRAEEEQNIRYECIRSPEELPGAFEKFLDIEASGWKGDAGSSSAIRCQPAMRAFYQALIDHFGARKECVINLLWLGDEAIAGEFALRTGGMLHVLKFGYREAFRKLAPGNMLLNQVIQQACTDPDVQVLNLVNFPAGTDRFKPQLVSVWSYVAPNFSLSGLAIHLALLLKRTLNLNPRTRVAQRAWAAQQQAHQPIASQGP
jgi:CelD/BcsL family acetyltransferase involved in cellulose biosynthesis